MSLDKFFYRITNIDDKWYRSFREIYTISFPNHEQRDEAQQILALENQHYHLVITIQNEAVASFIAYWEFDEYIYIEHLAVNPALRGNSIGSQILKRLATLTQKTIILEIDPLNDEISRKRLNFYQKLGYRVNPYQHFHPVYNPEFKPHELLVLSLNKGLTPDEYKKFQNDLSNIVMAN